MTINRKTYRQYFTKDNPPTWVCPTCQDSVLHIIPEQLIDDDTGLTKASYDEEWFDPELIRFTFGGILTCSNPKCKETVSILGKGGVERDYDGEFYRYYEPLFFHPPLKFFAAPEETPDKVKKALDTSFSFAFSNRSAAANQIRIALECLLNHLGVEQFNEKDEPISLHRRINLLEDEYSKIKEICIAIKWLGNSGSHCDEEMTMDNIFDGYEMMSLVLEMLYDDRHERIAILAKQINDKKGVH